MDSSPFHAPTPPMLFTSLHSKEVVGQTKRACVWIRGDGRARSLRSSRASLRSQSVSGTRPAAACACKLTSSSSPSPSPRLTVSPSGRKWHLEEFPKGYRFDYEWRTQRRRFYLLAGPTKRFGNLSDFCVHARWLLTDPDLDITNCICKLCCKATGGTAQKESSSSSRQASDTPVPPAPSPWLSTKCLSARVCSVSARRLCAKLT